MSRLDDLELIEPGSRAQWRAWLAEHAADSRGVWLAVGKKGHTVTSLTYDEAVEEALCFGWIDSTVRTLDEARFRQLLTPRKPGSNWSTSNKIRVARLTAEGLMTPAGLSAVERAQADGSWTRLDEIEAEVVPPDLAEALAAVPGAREGFDATPSSARKQALWRIASAKRPETRAARIAEAVRSSAGVLPGA